MNNDDIELKQNDEVLKTKSTKFTEPDDNGSGPPLTKKSRRKPVARKSTKFTGQELKKITSRKVIPPGPKQ